MLHTQGWCECWSVVRLTVAAGCASSGLCSCMSLLGFLSEDVCSLPSAPLCPLSREAKEAEAEGKATGEGEEDREGEGGCPAAALWCAPCLCCRMGGSCVMVLLSVFLPFLSCQTCE